MANSGLPDTIHYIYIYMKVKFQGKKVSRKYGLSSPENHVILYPSVIIRMCYRMPIWKWLLPLLFVAAGIFFLNFLHGHSFLGLVCLGIAAVISAYFALALVQSSHAVLARCLTIALSCVLAVGGVAFAVTEGIILHAAKGSAETHCDYILVLGAKVNGTTPSLSLQDRIDAAFTYLSAHPDTIAVLSGGQGPDEGISEAECMYRELTKRGIHPHRLLKEESSTSTRENITFCLDLIQANTGIRPDSPGILSSEYHLYRAGLYAKDCGVEAVLIPAPTGWPTIGINYFLREVAGVWYYWILGG